MSDLIALRLAYDPGVVRLLKKLLPERRWNRERQAWLVPTRYRQEVERFLAMLRGETIPDLPLYDFQRQGVLYSLRHGTGILLADEMGLGKTIQALAVLEATNAWPALVVMPYLTGLGPRRWADEARRWLPHRSLSILSTQGQGLTLADGGYVPPGGDGDLILCHYERLVTLAELYQGEHRRVYVQPQGDLATAYRRPLKGLVCDEAHYLKDYKAKRTRIVRFLATDIPVKMCLTGTPVLNRPADLISLLGILDRLDDLGGFDHFTRRYCGAKRTRFGLDLSGARNLEELATRMSKICYLARRKADILPQLPPVQREELVCDLTNREEYLACERDLSSWLRERFGRLRAERALRAEALARLNVLRQLVGQGKIDAACAWVQEAVEQGARVVVYAWHRAVQLALHERLLPFSPARVQAGNATANAEAVRRFQTGATPVIVCSLAAAREGIELTAASHILFAELPWRPADLEQAEARVYGRLSDPHGVHSLRLVGEGSCDAAVLRLLERKAEIIAQLREEDDLAMLLLEELAQPARIGGNGRA